MNDTHRHTTTPKREAPMVNRDKQKPQRWLSNGSSSAQPKPLMSVEEVAELLGQSRSSLYRAILNDSLPLPVLKIRGRYRIARIAVERLIVSSTAKCYRRKPSDHPPLIPPRRHFGQETGE